MSTPLRDWLIGTISKIAAEAVADPNALLRPRALIDGADRILAHLPCPDDAEWRRWVREALEDAEAARIREDLETWPGPR